MKYFSKIRLGLSSPEDIIKRSRGEVKKPETINYRTFAPEKDGLFCEAIFGPVKDWQCACGKYKRIRYKGIVCERCGVEVTKSKVRRERMGHIDLAVPVSHIWYSKGVPNNISLILGITSKELETVIYFARYIVIDPGLSSYKQMDIITENDYRIAIESGTKIKGGMGAEAILECLKSLSLTKLEKILRKDLEETDSLQKRKKLVKRLKVIKSFISSGNKPEHMIIQTLPVIPADLRPMVQLDGGRFATSDLNDLYRRVINRNKRLKKLQGMDAPEIILKNEKRMLQEAVDAVIDNSRRDNPVVTQNNRELKSLSDTLKGKQGRFRQNLLGKRVDYSGRSVIVVGPDLKLNQCGLPKKMALELYKPFIMKELVRKGISPNIKSAKKIIDSEQDIVWEVAEEVIKGHPVLLNRAPTLHKLSIQAFEPVLIEGKAIRLHPLVCTAFNADFDGDQMAVHLVLSPKSVMEAKTLMMSYSNLLSPAHGKPIMIPSREMLLGCYYTTKLDKREKSNTKFISVSEVKAAFFNEQIKINTPVDLRIDGEIVETSAGRVLFNDLLPQEMRDYSKTFVQPDLKKLISNMHDNYGFGLTSEVINNIKDFGFEYSTQAGISIGVNDLVIPSDKKERLKNAEKRVKEIEDSYQRGEIIKDERYRMIVDTWSDTVEGMTSQLLEEVDEFNSVFMMSQSGARGGLTQMRQLSGMRGLMADTQGRIMEIPIMSNFREGLSVLEFFMSSHGARKGSADKALRTADSGYLTRRLVDIAHDVIVVKDDCETGEGIEASAIVDDSGKVIESLKERVMDRYVSEDVMVDGEIVITRNEMVDEENFKLIDGKLSAIKIRSPLTCKAKHGICRMCYGKDLSIRKKVLLGEPVGVIAAQSIGEPGTQLTMRTFHTGGVSEKKSVDSDIFSPLEGKVEFIDLETIKIKEGNKVISQGGRVKIGNREIPIESGAIMKIEDGKSIKKGGHICSLPPYSFEIVAQYDGVVDLNNLHIKTKLDKRYGVKEFVVLQSHNPHLEHPHVELRDGKKGKLLADYLVPPGAFMMVKDGEKVKRGDVIAKILKEDQKSTKDITGGLPRVQQLLETRSPQLKAFIAESSGVVDILEERKKGMRVLQIKDEKNEVLNEYLIPTAERVIVNAGDKVERGTKLTGGPVYVNDILVTKGVVAAQEFILEAVQQVYREQGVEINDRHIEVIVRQMFKKVRVVDGGDSLLLEGEVVSKALVESENKKLEKKEKKPITFDPVVQGITRAAIDTESFISAASFQETTKVLSNAAIRGAVDNLFGLKENVIIGKQIPAGTGFEAYRNLDSGVEDENYIG